MNIVHGVAVCGDEKAYRRILHQFLERYQAGAAEWRSAPADRGLVLDLAHQLKSAASFWGWSGWQPQRTRRMIRTVRWSRSSSRGSDCMRR